MPGGRAAAATWREAREVLDNADKKTRFALIIMGLLNAVNFLLVARSDVFGPVSTDLGRGLAAYAALYAFLSLFFFTQAIEALRVVADDPRQAALGIVLGILGQQFRGMTDRGERVADLVRHVRRQAAKSGEFQLARLRLDPPHVFQIDQRGSSGAGCPAAGPHRTAPQWRAQIGFRRAGTRTPGIEVFGQMR